MIARFRILLPDVTAAPVPERLQPITLRVREEDLAIHPLYQVDAVAPQSWRPLRLDEIWERLEQPLSSPVPGLTVDGGPGVLANAICIDIKRAEFNRGRDDAAVAEQDQLADAAFEGANRVRTSIRGFFGIAALRSLDPKRTPWRMDFLDDSGQKVEKREGQIRGRGLGHFDMHVSGLSPQGWERIGQTKFSLLRWDELLLDAKATIPDLGPAIVLASAALESFISTALQSLAEGSTRVAPRLWAWINDRGDWRKEPSVNEQFDVLLQVLTDHSLKEQTRLWEDLGELRALRNSFAHEGALTVGKAQRPVSTERVHELIESAREIIAWIQVHLPEHLQFRREPPANVQFSQVLWAGDEPADPKDFRFV